MSTAYNMEGKDLHSGVEARLQQLTSQNNPVARLARNKRAMAASGARQRCRQSPNMSGVGRKAAVPPTAVLLV